MFSIAGSSLRLCFGTAAIAIGLLQGWKDRFNLSSEDAISYLDIADAYLRGDWQHVTNACWSPFYSWLLALALYIFKPSPDWEFFVVNLTNAFILLLAIACFDFFLRQLISTYRLALASSQKEFEIPESIWIIVGYSLFLLASCIWIGVGLDTPDLLTAAFIYLAAGFLLAIRNGNRQWMQFMGMGASLALGYLAKAIFIPVAFVFFLAVLFSLQNRRKDSSNLIPKLIAMLLTFAVIATPWITLMSLAEGQLTTGKVGKLNYIWFVAGSVKDKHWQGTEEGSGIPAHPTRQIWNDPPVYEFGQPIPGTDPTWYAPTYWYKGVKLQFNLKRQIQVVAENLKFYGKFFLVNTVLLYAAIAYICGRFKASIQQLFVNADLLIVPIAGLLIYLIGTNMAEGEAFLPARYIAPFVLILILCVFSSLRFDSHSVVKRFILAVSLAFLLTTAQTVRALEVPYRFNELTKNRNIYWEIAQTLNQIGVEPGDPVAVLGDDDNTFYPIRLARAKSVAQIPDLNQFWEQDAASQAMAIEAIKKTGAKVLLQQIDLALPANRDTSGWQKVGNLDCYLYPIQADREA